MELLCLTVTNSKHCANAASKILEKQIGPRLNIWSLSRVYYTHNIQYNMYMEDIGYLCKGYDGPNI